MKSISAIRSQLSPSRVNVAFSILCFFCPPVLGSAVSFVFNGGGVFSALLLALKRRTLNIDRPMLTMTVALYAYCAACVLASLVNNSLVSDAPHLVRLIPFLFFPLSYSTWSTTGKSTLAHIVMLASAAACFGALLLAIVQYYRFGIRAEGGAGNAIVFATVACLSAMMCFAGALSEVGRNRALLACAALAGTVAILYSGSRIIWLATLVAGFAVLLINRRRLTGKTFMRAALVAGAISVVIAAAGYPMISERAAFLASDLDALNTKGDHTTALGLRVAVWQIGIDAFREKPIFGHGMAAIRDLIRDGFHNQFDMKSVGFSHFHNGFLTALVEAGLVGAIALAAIFVVAARHAAIVLRTSTDTIERFGATMILVTVITYLIAGLTGILVGHDILDATLMVFLVSGTYLASGRQQPLPERVQTAMDSRV